MLHIWPSSKIDFLLKGFWENDTSVGEDKILYVGISDQSRGRCGGLPMQPLKYQLRTPRSVV